MIPTLDFMKDNFPKLNDRFFNGKLTMPKFELIRTKTTLGQYQYCEDLTPMGNSVNIDVIRMTVYYDMPEQTALEVLVHEMIHLWTHQTPDPNRPGCHLPVDHGHYFQLKAKEIMSKSTFQIHRTTSVAGCSKIERKKKKKP